MANADCLTLNQCKEKYIKHIKNTRTAKDKKTFENILDKLFNRDELKDETESPQFSSEAFSEAVKNTVMEYANSKDTAIEVLKEFSRYVSEKTETDVAGIEWPPIPVSSSFERMMFIAK